MAHQRKLTSPDNLETYPTVIFESSTLSTPRPTGTDNISRSYSYYPVPTAYTTFAPSETSEYTPSSSFVNT